MLIDYVSIVLFSTYNIVSKDSFRWDVNKHCGGKGKIMGKPTKWTQKPKATPPKWKPKKD